MSAFVFETETARSFTEAIVAVRKAVETAKWGILGSHDFGEVLAAKGFPQSEQYKVIEICAPAHANAMLAQDQLVALCMPCSILIYTSRGMTKIAALKPAAVLPALFAEKPGMLDDARLIEAEVIGIVESAAA
ncbi:MAG: DUF302 domain-containing protein [Armatimonadetes bacterium]|nr:DUF302 domain-containing protein [Armatimonadota bacterium]